jgi:hypothetical protein
MDHTHRLVLVVGGGRILWSVVLWLILATVVWVVMLWVVLAGLLRVVLTGLLWVDLLWTKTRRLLSIPSKWHPEEAHRRLRGILGGVTLLPVLSALGEGQIELLNSPSSAHGYSGEDAKDDQEADRRDSNACTDAQCIPANPIVEPDGGVS